MERENQELTLRVQQMETIEQKYTELKEENTALKARVAELESRLNSNSQNSSKPPSSDGYKKKPAFPKKKKGKQGGQRGHKGRTLQQVEHPDETVKCKPGPCDCGLQDSFQEDTGIVQRPVRVCYQ